MDAEAEQWVAKVKATHNVSDLSRDEDLSIALMNLISLEEHLFFTSQKTRKPAYLDMLSAIRTLRITLLRKIVTDPQGEEWCISKHLLGASMRLMEVGTKELARQSPDAEKYFNAAFELYSLFFGINLKIEAKKGFGSTIKDVVARVVNCCKEW